MKLRLFILVVLLSLILGTGSIEISKYQNYLRYLQAPAAAPAAPAAAAAPSQAQPSAPALNKQGWLRLSSLNLGNGKRYPPIILPDNKKKIVSSVKSTVTLGEGAISTGEAFFRKNDKFAPGGPIPTPDSFYFRLTGTNLYYTETQVDMIVLGAIAISNIEGSSDSDLGQNCFAITNNEEDEWSLCAQDDKSKQEWICAVSGAIGKPCSTVQTQKNPIIIEEKEQVKQPVMVIPLPSPYCNQNWNYNKEASDWNCKCSEGYLQSPIHLKSNDCVTSLEKPADFSFPKFLTKDVGIVYEENLMRIKCVNNCDEFVFSKIIDYNLTEYESREILFHTPGEHMINGQVFDMEIQVVYQPITEGDYAKKAILAFPVIKRPGGKNKFLARLDVLSLPNMYQTKTAFPESDQPITLEDLFLEDEDDSFYGFFSYFHYIGSLTAPPCDENVRWFVASKPISFGTAAVSMIRDVLIAPQLETPDGVSLVDGNAPSNPNGNARPKQDKNKRAVEYFDVEKAPCLPKFNKPTKSQGHFERIEKKAFTYVYIPSDEPSGLPNSFVVGENEARGTKTDDGQE